MPSPDTSLLSLTLQLAVPLNLAELDALRRRQPDAVDDQVRRWAADAVEAVGSRGDALMYRSKPGQSADVFNHLARGVAALATCPGGVRLFGVVYCLAHYPGGTHTDAAACPLCTYAELAEPLPEDDPRRGLAETIRTVETTGGVL
jgi:hypothetical protein